MVKFAKNDRIDALIVLARDEQFPFSLENDPKGGPLDDLFPFWSWIYGKQIFKKTRLKLNRTLS